jgi:hypothetical protein
MGVFWNNLKKNASDFFKGNVLFKGGLNSFSQSNTNKSKEGVLLLRLVSHVKGHAIADKYTLYLNKKIQC